MALKVFIPNQSHETLQLCHTTFCVKTRNRIHGPDEILAEEPHAENESPTTKFQNDPVQRVLRDGSKGFHTKPVSRSPTTLPYNILRKNAKIEYTVQTKFLAEEPHAEKESPTTKFQNDPVQRVLRDGSKGFHTKPVSRSPTTLPYNILRKNAKIEYTVQTKFLAEEPHAEKESPTTKFQNDPVQRVLRDGSKGF